MVRQAHMAEAEQALTLAQRRAYMTLPLEERRKRLAAQAERAMTLIWWVLATRQLNLLAVVSIPCKAL